MDNDTIEKLLNGSLNQTVASEASALPSADLLRQVEAARASLRPSADLLRQVEAARASLRPSADLLRQVEAARASLRPSADLLRQVEAARALRPSADLLRQVEAARASLRPSADLLRQVEAARASLRPSADLLRQVEAARASLQPSADLLRQVEAARASLRPSADLLRQVEAARASLRPSADLLRQALGATIAPLSVVPNETRSESALSPSIASHQSDSQAIVRLFGYMDLFDALITDPGLIRFCRQLFLDGHYSMAVLKAVYLHQQHGKRAVRYSGKRWLFFDESRPECPLPGAHAQSVAVPVRTRPTARLHGNVRGFDDRGQKSASARARPYRYLRRGVRNACHGQPLDASAQ